MYIYDLNGDRIEVTNLKAAVKQAAFFKDLRHKEAEAPEVSKADDERQRYWTDLHEKLLQVVTELKNIKP